MAEIRNHESAVEKQLRDELDRIAPDIFDDLINEIDSRDKDNTAEMPQGAREVNADDVIADYRDNYRADRSSEKQTSPAWKWIRTAGALAAAFIIFAGAGAWFGRSGETDKAPDPVAMIGLDVNPSIELFIDDTDRVTECRPVNDDGEKIIGEMDMTGADIKVAANALVGSMLTHGYLTDANNSIFLSVVTDDSSKGKELEQELTKELNGYFENAAVSAAVMGEYIEENEEIASFARDNSISTGKAWLIKALAAGSRRTTEESLLRLTTQELLLIWSENDAVQDENTVRYGDVNSGGYISGQDACEAALKKAGLSYDSVSDLKAEFECEDGRLIYEVDFTHDGREYEYEVDAKDGTIIGSDDSVDDRDEDNQDEDDDRDDDDDGDDRDDDDGDDRDNDDDDDDDND